MNRCESDRTLRDGSFGVALSEELRARLRSHRPPGTFRQQVLAKVSWLSSRQLTLTTDNYSKGVASI
jgi:hypothetical protein